MDSRNAFMRTIRRSLGISPDTERPKKLYPALFVKTDTTLILQDIKNRTAEQQDELVELLQVNAQALGIKFHIVRSHDEAAAIIVELVRNKTPEFAHTKHIIHHDHPDLTALKLWKRFNREGITVHTTFTADRQLREKTIASFIGITAPDIGVAESATLIQLTKPGCPRSTSLVPSIHIALLKQENLMADLREAYALLRQEVRLDSFVIITGPSKTADIEATMVHGAHGPREVHLLVLCPPQAEETASKATNPTDSDGQQTTA
jgi:L-lactate dehydrogenase complex protein LldG